MIAAHPQALVAPQDHNGGDESAPAFLTIRSLFSHNRWRILTTYLLFNVENLLRLAQPFALGWAINDLLRSSYVGLALLITQHLLHMLISSFRQMYDTRAFTSIYTDLATRLVLEQRRQEVDVSRVAARSALSRGYVEFLEHYVPMIIRAAYSIVGALAMLAFYDQSLIYICLILLVPACLLNLAYSRRTLALNKRLHDQFEREVEVIERNEGEEVRSHYDAVARWRIRLSDAEAINFSLMELFVLGVMVAALVKYCTLPGVAAGDIFAVFRYVLMFVMAMDSVPKLVQQVSRMRDIGFRMRGGGAPRARSRPPA